MDIRHGLDSEHLAVVESLPADLVDVSDLEAARARLSERLSASDPPPVPDGVTATDESVVGVDGERVIVRTYSPASGSVKAPALVWMHGGGLVLGHPAMNEGFCLDLAHSMGIFVASVDYRLAPEHPYPTPLEDCYTVLKWLWENADSLGVDRCRITVGGMSAGGGLAAGLALLARDRGEIDVCFQLLRCPMLDHRDQPDFAYEFTDSRLWNPSANAIGWSAYLGDLSDGGTIPAYASPAIADDLNGLPPAMIAVGDHDLFVTEDIAYASALLRHGVPTELHVYQGAFHGSHAIAPHLEVSQRWIRDERDALRRALKI